MRKLIIVFVLAMLALPTLAQSGSFAEPANAELSKYPIKTAPLTLAEQAQLGLSAKKLDRPVVVQNHFRNVRGGRFVLETLPTGTLVLVGKDDRIRYKADCGNRLVEPEGCTACHTGGNVAKKADLVGKTATTQPGAWSRFWDNFTKAFGYLMVGLGFLIPLLLALFLLWILFLILRELAQNFRDWWHARRPVPQPVNPVPNPPAPAPVAPAPAPVVPAPVPQPAPAPPAPGPGFPARRVIVDLGGGNNATRIQSGNEIARIEFERDRNNGSTSIRIFET